METSTPLPAPPLPPVTTAEQDRMTYGQRRVNLIWETTQAMIALGVTGAALYASLTITLRSDMDKTAFIFLTNVLMVIIGFYFGRTNHQKIGGVGPNDAGR